MLLHVVLFLCTEAAGMLSLSSSIGWAEHGSAADLGSSPLLGWLQL